MLLLEACSEIVSLRKGPLNRVLNNEKEPALQTLWGKSTPGQGTAPGKSLERTSAVCLGNTEPSSVAGSSST
jgi:hypothetical protein